MALELREQPEYLSIVAALVKIATGEGKTSNGRKRYYSSYDSLQCVAKEALNKIIGISNGEINEEK